MPRKMSTTATILAWIAMVFFLLGVPTILLGHEALWGVTFVFGCASLFGSWALYYIDGA